MYIPTKSPQVWAWFAVRRFQGALGLVSELASFSVSAISTPKIEAGFTIRQAGSDHFLLYQNRSTYVSASAMSVPKS